MLTFEEVRKALDRIAEIDGVSKTHSAIDAINEEAFDSLPLEDQLKSLMKANQELVHEIKKECTNL